MSCYRDAAHSMAAVGMIAPLIESAFRAAFRSIGNELPRRNLVKEIVKRVEDVGMKEYPPPDLEPTLSALFEYRNKMLHGGFEWSTDELEKFERLLDAGRWPPDWFSKATTGDEPWMSYMTSAFVYHCLEMAEGVISGIEQFGLGEIGTHSGRPSRKPGWPSPVGWSSGQSLQVIPSVPAWQSAAKQPVKVTSSWLGRSVPGLAPNTSLCSAWDCLIGARRLVKG